MIVPFFTPVFGVVDFETVLVEIAKAALTSCDGRRHAYCMGNMIENKDKNKIMTDYDFYEPLIFNDIEIYDYLCSKYNIKPFICLTQQFKHLG